MQKRSFNKKHAPGKWDITAGHVDTKEKEEDAMIREMNEEIGLIKNKEELELLSIIKRNAIATKNNAFQYHYFTYTDKNIADYIMKEDEVIDLKYVTINELEQIIREKDDNYTFSKREYIKDIIEKLKERVELL